MAEAQLKAGSQLKVAPRNIPKGFHRIFNSLISHGILLLYSALALFPLFLILINSFKDRKDLFRVPYQPPIWFSLENGLSFINISSTKGYEQVFARADVLNYFRNSFFVTSVALFLILLTGAMASYALSEYTFRGNRFIGLYMALGVMIPIRLGTVSLIRMTSSMGIYNSPIALICVYTASGLPIALFIMTEFMRSVPRELKDAARVDGASEYRILFTLVMPLIRPALATVLIFNMIPIWNDLWFPLTLTPEFKTVTSGLSSFAGQYKTDWTALLAALALAMVPVLAFYIIFSRQFIRGLTRGALK
jgi:raffinose/stachyose/melibiose transport system permease protein